MAQISEMRNKTAVIIVDYHSEALLRRCLDSLRAISREDLAFVVVDNGQSIDRVRFTADYPEATVLRPDTNVGFPGGCNLGMKYALDAGAPRMLLLNPDTRAVDDFIGPLVRVLSAHPELGMVGPTIVNDDVARDVWYAGGNLNWWIGRPSNIRDDRFLNYAPFVQVPFLSGCAMLLRAEAVRRVGLMDDRYFLYFEDADYTQAFLRAGWQAAYVPEAVVLHAPSSTTGYHSETYVYYFARNRIWFERRWARWYHYVVFVTFSAVVKLPGAIIVFGLIRRRPRLVAAFFRGFWDGLRGSRRR